MTGVLGRRPAPAKFLLADLFLVACLSMIGAESHNQKECSSILIVLTLQVLPPSLVENPDVVAFVSESVES